MYAVLCCAEERIDELMAQKEDAIAREDFLAAHQLKLAMGTLQARSKMQEHHAMCHGTVLKRVTGQTQQASIFQVAYGATCFLDRREESPCGRKALGLFGKKVCVLVQQGDMLSS